MKIKKGDNVKILSGKDRGRTGKVLHAMPDAGTVIIEGLNLVKKRARPKRQGEKGETVLVPRALAVSKVMLICTNCKNPTRVGLRMAGERRVRYCKKCQATI
jgi:large subunit ribosomal protein L24